MAAPSTIPRRSSLVNAKGDLVTLIGYPGVARDAAIAKMRRALAS